MTNIVDCNTQIMCYKKNATKSRKGELEWGFVLANWANADLR